MGCPCPRGRGARAGNATCAHPFGSRWQRATRRTDRSPDVRLRSSRVSGARRADTPCRAPRPHTGVAGVGPRVVLPRLVADFAGLRDGLEHPQALSRSYVEAADGSLDVAAALRIGAGLERRADDDDVAGDDRGRVKTDRRAGQVHRRVEIGLQIDGSSSSETGDRITGSSVERDQPVSGRDVEDALFLAVAPVGEAAAGKLSRRGGAASALVLAVYPQQLAGAGIERDHGAPRAAGGVEASSHHERCRLQVEFRTRTEVVRLETPCDFEVVEVRRRDLVERGVAGVAKVSTIGWPLTARRPGLPEWPRGQERGEDRRDASTSLPAVHFEAGRYMTIFTRVSAPPWASR